MSVHFWVIKAHFECYWQCTNVQHSENYRYIGLMRLQHLNQRCKMDLINQYSLYLYNISNRKSVRKWNIESAAAAFPFSSPCWDHSQTAANDRQENTRAILSRDNLITRFHRRKWRKRSFTKPLAGKSLNSEGKNSERSGVGGSHFVYH